MGYRKIRLDKMSPIVKDVSLLESSKECITCVRFIETTFTKLFNNLSGGYLNELGKAVSNPKPKQKRLELTFFMRNMI
jgi:hypothetical protein